MNVLEKILEEIIDNLKVEGIIADNDRGHRAVEIIRSHMDEVTSEKEKVTSAEIISSKRKNDEKPYYHIKFKKVGEDEYTIGYSSFKLDYVVEWLNNYFEFHGEAKVSCDNNGWIPVEERLPEDCEEIVLVQVSEKPADNILFDNAFGLALYEKEEGWMLDNYPEWKNPEVIAWCSLPEPYKPKEKVNKCKNTQQEMEDFWNDR